jgi:DNA-binding transcriptional regulator GbsR (MarR family)
MHLSQIQQDFIAHFGEMGNRWGINRTVGQIYALLYVSKDALCADDISELLGISRSNVSMSLKELDSWRLLRVRHIRGDRKDYFTAPEDIWEIVRTLMDERFKREVAPTLSVLRDILLSQEKLLPKQIESCSVQEQETIHTQEKLQEMYDLMEMLSNWHRDLQKVETSALVKMLQFGTKIFAFLDLKEYLPFIKKKDLDD